MISAKSETTHTIELVGSYIARHVESGLTEDRKGNRGAKTTKSAIPVLCRKLLAAGYPPGDRVHIVRQVPGRDGYMPIFKRDRTLATWGALDCVESDTRSLRVVKHVPFHGVVKANNVKKAVGGIDATMPTLPAFLGRRAPTAHTAISI